MKITFLTRYYIGTFFMILSLWILPNAPYKRALLKRIYGLKNECLKQVRENEQ